MSPREFYNAVDGAREVREFEATQSWKQAQKVISMLALNYLAQFPQKSQASARKNIETVLSEKPESEKPRIGYTLEEIEKLNADAIRTAERMNKQIEKQKNGVS